MKCKHERNCGHEICYPELCESYEAPNNNASVAACLYCLDEICVNADCPMCADYCPVVDFPDVCKHEERERKSE